MKTEGEKIYKTVLKLITFFILTKAKKVKINKIKRQFEE